MSITACGFCARAGFDECFCGAHPEEAAESAGMAVHEYYIGLGRDEENARLRPLLERCYGVVDDRGLLAELECELGLMEG